MDDLLLDPGDGAVHARLDGHADNPVVALVHGSAASVHSWDPLVPALAETYRVVRLDLLGHGRSAKPAGADYGITAQADRCATVLGELGIERAALVGHSTGGVVVTALAERRPELVRAVALVDTGPSSDAFIAPPIEISPQLWAAMDDERIRAAMQPAFSRPGYEIPQQFVDDVRSMTYESFAATMRAPHDYLADGTLPARLAATGIPLLVIFGRDDRRWRASAAADYDVVPGARVELLDGLGHSPHLEDPARTSAVLLPFLAAHAAG